MLLLNAHGDTQKLVDLYHAVCLNYYRYISTKFEIVSTTGTIFNVVCTKNILMLMLLSEATYQLQPFYFFSILLSVLAIILSTQDK